MKPLSIFSLAAIAASLTLSLGAPQANARGHGFGGFRPPTTQPGQNHAVSQTVAQGQLDGQEVDGLNKQEDALEKAIASYTGDEKLTADQLDKLEEQLDAASFFIWSKGLNDDGKVATLYGKSIFPVDELNKRFEAKDITKSQARMLLTALKNLAAMKLKLNGELTVEGRLALQKEFDAGLSKIFTTK